MTEFGTSFCEGFACNIAQQDFVIWFLSLGNPVHSVGRPSKGVLRLGIPSPRVPSSRVPSPWVDNLKVARKRTTSLRIESIFKTYQK